MATKYRYYSLEIRHNKIPTLLLRFRWLGARISNSLLSNDSRGISECQNGTRVSSQKYDNFKLFPTVIAVHKRRMRKF